MLPYIHIQALGKNFNATAVLASVTFSVERGEIFGLLGVNGAGKTTLIRCLLGLSRISAGCVLFEGKAVVPKIVQDHFGFLPENFLPPCNVSAEEFIGFVGRGVGAQPEYIAGLFDLAGLRGQERKRIGQYSRGMIQRLGLVRALLKNPQVLILDEPTSALDPVGQRDMLRIMASLRAQHKTVIFSSHSLVHMEKICGRIGILHQGVLRYAGAIAEYMQAQQAATLEEAFLKDIGAHA